MTATLLDTPADHWQTLLFVATTAPGTADGISARRAYQLALHGRAVIVDTRAPHERAAGRLDPSLPVVTDLTAALADPVGVVAVVGELPLHVADPRVERVAGGFDAWAAAGLPVALADVAA